MKIKLFSLSLLTFMILSSCSDEVIVENYFYDKEDYDLMSQYIDIPTSPYNYTLDFPDYITSFVRTDVNANMATLGRVLFYDVNLSSDRSISCASCHKQELAFSDNVAFSKGAGDRSTTRNSLALGSVINFSLYYGDQVFNGIPFFWDNSAQTIQQQSTRTIANPNEMNMPLHDVVDRVNELPYYAPLAEKAFGTKTMSETDVLDAIATFTNAITTYDTKFDKALESTFKTYGTLNGKEKNNFADLTAQENAGKNIYMTNCSACHGLLAGRPGKINGNNGLYEVYSDFGEGSYNGNAKFKIPTLRNILRTAPYMHDGSLATIDEVLDHYSTGIKNTTGLSDELKSGNQPKNMYFTEDEREALKAFFVTMNDNEIVNDQRFADPFKQ